MFWVGILLLVSAGSFLYVACLHILPEVYGDKEDPHHLVLMEPEDNEPKHYSKLIEFLAILIGLYIPYFLMFIH